MPTIFRIEVGTRMLNLDIVPHHKIARLPRVSMHEFRLRYMLGKFTDQIQSFIRAQSNDVVEMTRVAKHDLFPSKWMGERHRMSRANARLRLSDFQLICNVDDLKVPYSLAHRGWEVLVRQLDASEHCVAACAFRWNLYAIQ